jgi:DNA polymerase
MEEKMNNKEIIEELRKAMEFYQELGFEYLPLKKTETMGFLAKTHVNIKQDNFITKNSKINISDKEKALKKLRNEIGDCQRCKLSKSRKNIVFGEGDPDTELMFIGEGPGKDEDLQARPFVGDAGKLLTNLIKKMGLRREEVYIANIVKCRPPFNREPEKDEISACRGFVEKQIEIIKPKVIITLGKIAAQTLLETKVPISKLRGNFHNYHDIPVMPTFHPAYLLRNPKDKWLTWEDVQKALEKLRH